MKTRTIEGIKTFIKQGMTPLEPGAMSYLMSKEQYFTDSARHNWIAHLMFYSPPMDGAVRGANLPHSGHVESTVQWRSGTDRCIHGCCGQMVGWNNGLSQIGAARTDVKCVDSRVF